MRAFVSIIVLTYLAVCIVASQTEEKSKRTAVEVMEKVQETYASVNDASAEFTQTVSFKYAKIEQSFSGTVIMKKGSKYRIESQQQTLVTDGKTVWAYSPVNKQVLIDSYKENPNTFSPEKFLVGLPKNFRATFVSENAVPLRGTHAGYVLKLLPKSDAPKFVKSLKVWIDDANWSVRKVEYVDMNETRTVYSLREIKFNSGIADEQFTFSIPADVEAVDLRSLEPKLPRH